MQSLMKDDRCLQRLLDHPQKVITDTNERSETLPHTEQDRLADTCNSNELYESYVEKSRRSERARKPVEPLQTGFVYIGGEGLR